MLTTYLTRLACAAALFVRTHAQNSSIPADLSIGFETSSVSFQVSYVGDPENGFKDGTTFKKADVAKEPEFAFGDSSGIATATKYLIVLLDISCDSARTLHYAKPDFKYDFDITSISSNATAIQEYKPPGAFGETGDGRKYAFLFYNQPGNNDIATMKIPKEGEAFEVKSFQDDNGLVDSVAGVEMVVNLGGSVSCDGKAAATGASTAAAASSGASKTSSVGDASAATASASTTGSPKSSKSAAGFTTTPLGGLEGPSSSAKDQSTELVAASTALVGTSQTGASASGQTASGTATGAAATATGAASVLSLATTKYVIVASLFMFAGLLAF
ncbi:uncharacterized protein BDZ99DRAFT_299854 [Mytilinidion resinicola]|uniref:Uncharacterized protein n=1 Tax=Mytilinidion resinicola TaxID=574789 RepID=A0A6A6YMA1_9PEZI|nr:uncharacterized protein BDZ99DRAFT_299854 [Mytilinidion resinicola]KAF2809920.1 hypothetical protein BDZ99DRAFT_299854 [Mytilinidion resinicola]